MSYVLDKLKLFRRNRMMCEIKMDEVSKIIEGTELKVFGQSIVDLQHNKVYATEYLNRPLKDSGFEHPGEFYAFAANHGMIAEVDVCAIENTQTHLPKKVSGKIFVNIHLSTLFSIYLRLTI
jgi:EAL domain-containing protein (putative c-di-GMP-specific phosphodiesterase class I)